MDRSTDDWISTLAERAAAVTVDAGLDLVIEQRLADDPDTAWHLEFRDGSLTVHRGRHPEPRIVLTSPRATVDAIRGGELSAQRAFLDGDLRIGGDIATLLDHRTALAAVAELLAAT